MLINNPTISGRLEWATIPDHLEPEDVTKKIKKDLGIRKQVILTSYSISIEYDRYHWPKYIFEFNAIIKDKK
jgi:hypothetical protein